VFRLKLTFRKLLLQLIVHVPYYLLLTTSIETLRKLLLQLIVHVPYYLLLTTSTETLRKLLLQLTINCRRSLRSVSIEVVSNK
jgi:hypothetical protein